MSGGRVSIVAFTVFVACLMMISDAVAAPCFAGKKTAELAPPWRLQREGYIGTRMFDEAGYLNRRWGLRASVHLFDGKNAMAAPDGSVYIGTQNYNHFDTDEARAQGAGFLLAHEYAHQLQFKLIGHDKMKKEATPHIELQADCIAGYWYGHRAQQQLAMGASGLAYKYARAQIVRAAHEIGDYAFDDPRHHGTPDQRSSIVSACLDKGMQDSERDSVHFGRDLIKWSMSSAKAAAPKARRLKRQGRAGLGATAPSRAGSLDTLLGVPGGKR